MSVDDRRSVGTIGAPPDHADVLRDAITREYSALRRGIAMLAWKIAIAGDRESTAAIADEVLSEVVARALRRAADFDLNRSAHAWLLGIAVNVLRERKRQHWLARQRQPLPLPSTTDTLDQTASEAILGTLEDLAAASDYRLIELLDLVGPSDRQVLSLAFVERLHGPALAEALGVKEGTARVRLSRAVARLGVAYRQAEIGSEER